MSYIVISHPSRDMWYETFETLEEAEEYFDKENEEGEYEGFHVTLVGV